MSHLLETAARLANSGLAQVTFGKSRGLGRAFKATRLPYEYSTPLVSRAGP